MPFNSDIDILPTYSRLEFCRALKSVRERKGITLDEIAAATKVPASLFAALEHNDLRRWPKGLFRRAFFRDYVGMIGLPIAETCDEFVRLFGDDEAVAKAAEEANQVSVRLVLDAGWRAPRPSVLSRIAAALVDSGVILLTAGIAWVAGKDVPQMTAIAAVAYFSIATVIFGESPAKWVLSRRSSIVTRIAEGRTAIASAWSQGTDSISGVLSSADGDTAEPVDESHLQVRIKVS
jgi:cytoskeletal protein RodZ